MKVNVCFDDVRDYSDHDDLIDLTGTEDYHSTFTFAISNQLAEDVKNRLISI